MFFSINRFYRISALVIASIGLIIFQPAHAKEVKISNLAPMSEPAHMKTGTVIQGITNRKPSADKLISTNGSIQTWQDNEGCVWTKDISLGFFSPYISWTTCHNKTGSLRVHGKSGNIWPLKVGNLVEYTVKGRNVGGGSWSANRRCKVDKQVRITTHTGTYDTFKVICRTKWYTRIWYMSPKIGASVKYIKRPSSLGRNNKPTDFELTRIVGR